MRTPVDHRSAGVLYGVPITTSGATVSGDPSRSVSPSPRSWAAKPKSQSLKTFCSTGTSTYASRTFSHLMSLCTTEWLCTYSSASSTCCVTMAAACSGKPLPSPPVLGCRTMASNKSPPRQYSNTSVTVPGSSKYSKSATMCGCFIVKCVLTSPSSPKRYCMSRGCKRDLRTILAARSLTTSPVAAAPLGTHLHTSPKVPSPSGPLPTSEYLSSNSDTTLRSSSSPASRKRFEQLSSRTRPPFADMTPSAAPGLSSAATSPFEHGSTGGEASAWL
mmetsp:Transcript_116347/g.324180  ORF Transcript_116347/g.324180 Transcript_116347/m.324180 type:complete len:275 (-) Transcript_116347:705-1529(-)